MNDTKRAISTTVVDEINNHAEQATAKANQAMHHAIEAGKLLLEVKASLGHGQFGEWLEANVKVSPRQAQRYMAAAEGKSVRIRELTSKYDTVSHLPPPATARHDDLTQWLGTPEFIPTPGHWMLTVTDEAAFHVLPSLEHPGFFHVSKLYTTPAVSFDPEFHIYEGEQDSFFDGTKRPVLAVAVSSTLQHLGMAEPSKAEWSSKAHPGLSRPFGEPDSNLDATRQAIEARFPGHPHFKGEPK